MANFFHFLVVVILVFCIISPVSSAIVNPPVRSVPPGGTGPVYIYVTPAPTPKPVNYLTVEVSPSNATITIDGGYGPSSPMGSPLTGSNSPTKSVTYSVSPGTHTVRAGASGYKTHTEQIKIDNGDRSHISITLEKDLNYVAPVTPVTLASFEVTSHPAGASVYVDGQPNGTTPCTISATAGSRTVTLRLEGYLDRTETVDIRKTSSRTSQKVFWILTPEEAQTLPSRPVQTETQKRAVANASPPAVTTMANLPQGEPVDLLQHVIYFFRGIFGGICASCSQT